ncbi:hypothetical protein Cantr_10239 [Candida viswanathii]|uniref:U6 snRNA phosphodiesterase n=1 Tax=Candida viswanathii TaxID=5486 RepID=A0A367YCB1_9ASCO|nr:hypothetical protein Cantr_10239 [Candida viswanathii]
MDLIQQYDSDTDTEPEGDVEVESEREEEENTTDTNLPPLPDIQIYLQNYQQNMTGGTISTFCYIPWQISLQHTLAIDRICNKVLKQFPVLTDRYRFMAPHKDVSREIKHHITTTYNDYVPVSKHEDVASSFMKRFSELEVPPSLVREVGGGSSPLQAILNKRRKVVLLRFKDHLTVRGAGRTVFLCAYLNESIVSQTQYCEQLYTSFLDVLRENGINPQLKENGMVPYHVSVKAGYLQGAPLSREEVDKISEEVAKIKLSELAEIPVDVEEILCLMKLPKGEPRIYRQPLL